MPTFSLAQDASSEPIKIDPREWEGFQKPERRELLNNTKPTPTRVEVKTERNTDALTAEQREQKRLLMEETRAKNQAALCERIGSEVTRISSEVNKARTALVEKNQERKTEVKSKVDETKQRLTVKRDEAEDRVSTRLRELETSATSEQKAAIGAFRTAMEAARNTRKAAVDAAQEAFRTAIDTAANSRKSTVESAANDYRTAVNAALEKAKSDCASGVDPRSVKEALTAALRAAKQALQEDRKALDTKTGVEEAVKTRNAAVKTAHEAFAATLKAELEKLKAAFATGEEDAETEQE